MDLVLKEKITGPSVWFGADIAGDASWIHELSDENLSEIDTALDTLKLRGRLFPDFTKDDFPIEQSLTDLLQSMTVELESGKGFMLLRGLPIHQYTESDIEALYFGLGLHLGSPVCQNPKGDMLGRVINVGELGNKETRVYETNAYLPYHTDLSDVFGLICVRKAKVGA